MPPPDERCLANKPKNVSPPKCQWRKNAGPAPARPMRSIARFRLIARGNKCRRSQHNSGEWLVCRHARTRGATSRCSAIPNRALLLPLGGRKSKPGFGERPSALERALQIGLFALDRLAADFVRHFNGRNDDQHDPGEWPGKLKKVP